VATTFLVLRTNDTSPQLYWHDGQNIDPTGLGVLPTAALEALPGASRTNVKHNNRVFTFLDTIFAIQDGRIFESTDEAATFALTHTLTGTAIANSNNAQCIAPIPVMVLGALKLIGFYFLTTGNVGIMEYDVAGGTWSSSDSGVAGGVTTSGMTVPVFYQGLVYARTGAAFVAYDPVSTGTVTITGTGLISLGADQMFSWNGDLWVGPVAKAGNLIGMASLQGSAFNFSPGGVTVVSGDGLFATSKAGVFVDPNTNNLIVMLHRGGNFSIYRITTGLVVTDITGTVKGPALTTLGGFGLNSRIWPHITRAPGGVYSVTIYGSRGADTTDPVERFEWVDDATQITEIGVVGGTGDLAFPYAIYGGDQYGFFAGEKRVLQTAQASNSLGITVTCEAFQDSGTTLSVRGHFDKAGVDANPLTLSPMTLSNPLGTGGLSVSGVNPGAQVDGVPANRTAITFDWDQVTDGFITGDNYSFQLEGL